MYVLTIGWHHDIVRHEIPKRILIIDVATETSYTYGLPDYETQPYVQPMVGVFELTGQLCFFAHVIDPMALHFWTMTQPKDKDLGGDKEQHWDLRYRFHMKELFYGRPSAWLDSDEMLCYMKKKTMHIYNTGEQCQSISNADILEWDEEVQLPTSPERSECQWNIYGGYCPTLLSPLTFVLPPFPDNDENKDRFDHAMLSILQRYRKIKHSTQTD
jgi:hypothetical protein